MTCLNQSLPTPPPLPRRLKVPDQAAGGRGKFIDHGVHAFIVPLRDANGCLLPGVEIHDCGYKVCVGGGVQGVAKVHLRILMSTGLILNMNTTAVGPPLVLL